MGILGLVLDGKLDLADCMTATTCLVCLGALRGSPLVACHKQVHDLFGLLNGEFGHAVQAYALQRIITKVQVRVLRIWHKQITYNLIVYLYITHPYVIALFHILLN